MTFNELALAHRYRKGVVPKLPYRLPLPDLTHRFTPRRAESLPSSAASFVFEVIAPPSKGGAHADDLLP